MNKQRLRDVIFTAMKTHVVTSEDGSSIGLRNVGVLPHHSTALQPGRLTWNSSWLMQRLLWIQMICITYRGFVVWNMKMIINC